jgi:hypothetical protein
VGGASRSIEISLLFLFFIYKTQTSANNNKTAGDEDAKLAKSKIKRPDHFHRAIVRL